MSSEHAFPNSHPAIAGNSAAVEKPTHCADCGSRLDAFGICPNASPRDAAIMTAPVNCGKRPVLDPDSAMRIHRDLQPELRPDAADARHYARLAHIDYAEAYRMPRPTGMNHALMDSAYLYRAKAIRLGADAEAIDSHFADVRERFARKAVA